eukprot:440073-Rhodomonas_salina.1
MLVPRYLRLLGEVFEARAGTLGGWQRIWEDAVGTGKIFLDQRLYGMKEHAPLLVHLGPPAPTTGTWTQGDRANSVTFLMMQVSVPSQFTSIIATRPRCIHTPPTPTLMHWRFPDEQSAAATAAFPPDAELRMLQRKGCFSVVLLASPASPTLGARRQIKTIK